MKLKVRCTASGLIPLYDEDYDEKRKLKNGKDYEVTVKLLRNVKFHRMYFGLINLSWEYLNDHQRAFFRNNVEVFRKTVEVSAGHCEPCYSITKGEWIEVPKSIAFDKLGEPEFSDLYERIKDIIYNTFIPSVSKAEFEEQLKYF